HSVVRRADRLLPEAPLARSIPRTPSRQRSLAQSGHPSDVGRESHRRRDRERVAKNSGHSSRAFAMSRAQLLWLHLSIALTAITGIVFAWMKYAMKSGDPFAVANHPLQPHMLSAHVLLAPAMTFVLGWTFANHIWPRIVMQDPRRRLTGLTAAILIVPM